MLERCLWTETASASTGSGHQLPERADVAVVGGGYTGLSAARTLARHGADVVLLERHTLGWGASSRNGGFVLPGFKPGIDVLARKLGPAEARRLFEISLEAVRALEELIDQEAIACDYARCGSVQLAAKPRHLRSLEASRRFLQETVGYQTEVLGPAEVRAEVGSARYHGGLLDPGAGAIHPARYLLGLAGASERAGARLFDRVEVRRLERTAAGFSLETSRGAVVAREVLVATNGYTDGAFPRLQRRVLPIGSYVIATSPLDPELARRLVPRGRVLSDTKHLLYYFRLSPDRRMVFGGRVAFGPTAIARSARILAEGMHTVFPELRAVPVEYAWGGQVGFTLDQLPHVGRLDGVHHALGYCGHGVAMATYLGSRMGQALAGASEPPELGKGPFSPVPLHAGRRWLLPLVGRWYRAADMIS